MRAFIIGWFAGGALATAFYELAVIRPHKRRMKP